MQNLSIRVYEGANMISKGYLQEVRENITSLTNYPFYRTHVHMGSDHWVAMSLTTRRF